MLKDGFTRNFCLEGWNHRRIPVALDIEYWPMNASKSRTGRMYEIGMDGFSLCLREYLEIAHDLRISLLCDFGSEFLLVEPHVQVVWNERPLEGNCLLFHSGVKIMDISAIEHQILECFLHSFKDHIGNINTAKRT